MLDRLRMHLKGLVDRSSRRIRYAFRPKSVPLGVVLDLTRTRQQLLAENAALRHRNRSAGDLRRRLTVRRGDA